MEINRNNYPIWITDLRDGSLPPEEEEKLFLFLNENKDIGEEFDSGPGPVLYPDISLRINSESFKKDLTDLSPYQQEELMVALIEGDLAGDEADNIRSALNNSSDVSETFNSLSRIKLNAPHILYPDRGKLKRISLQKSVARIARHVLALAAALAIPVSLLILLPGRTPQTGESNNAALHLPALPGVLTDAEKVDNTDYDRLALESSGDLMPVVENRIVNDSKAINQPVIGEPHVGKVDLSEKPDEERQVFNINPAPVSATLPVTVSSPDLHMAEMIPVEISPVTDDNPVLGESVASNIRNLILKKDAQRVDNISTAEIAGATVNGVNKILGWDMKLEKDRDENGNVSSVRFTSQLIKVDHKKKTGSD